MNIQSSTIPARRGSILFLIAIVIILGISSRDYGVTNTDQLIFLSLNGGLLLYLSWEISRLARKEKWRALLCPVVLASLYHFAGSYLLPNLRHVGNFEWKHINGYFLLAPDPYKWMNLAMLGVLLAVFAMWRGYYSQIASRIAWRLRVFLLRKRILKKGSRINIAVVILLVFLSFSAFLLNVKLGIFGYSSEADSLMQLSSIRGFIKLGTDCGPLVLLVLSMAVFSRHYRGNGAIRLLFAIVLSLQILVGFLSGFKSQVVMPVIITGFGYYVAKHRVPVKLILISFLMLVAAYQVIEPFRNLRYSDNTFDSRSISSIANAMVEAATSDSLQEKQTFQWKTFVARQDMMTFTAVSVAYKERRGKPPDSPSFITNIFLSPFLAFIPRIIWHNKPMANDGHWYNVAILGAHPSTLTAVGMGPISYCYFGGGYLMVFIVFWIIGLLQRIIFKVFVDDSLGGWIIYLSLLSSLITLPSNIGLMLAGFFRIVPFAILVQYLLIKPVSDYGKFTICQKRALS